jgi:hypothetical protein
MDQRIRPVGPLLLKHLCQFLSDSVLHTVLPQGIHPQFGEHLPKMIIEGHLHHFVVVEAGTALTMAVQAVTEILTVQAATRIMIGTSETMTVAAGTGTTTGPGIQKKDEIAEGSMTIADTGAPAHVIGAEAGAAAGAEAGAEVGAGMNIDQVHLGTQTKRRQLLRAT